ncbi:hypothetical protein AAFF_G00334150 [Aldrovandia affinis]|uniref:Uncharacterized protein n=1 Tax=Aldrovandia affinis TaxID=143900 RepID=A0AAD7R6I9_9TELE|nr:hypothetical protein AAFF_G00334150 [Aldrovandia affinis]
MEEIVLATLNCATTVMSMETQVSNIYPIIFSLLKTHLLRSEDDSRRVGQFKSKVRQSLSTRMGLLLPGSTDLPDTNKKGRGTLPPTFLQHHVPLQRSAPILYPTLLPHPATEDPPTITNG